MDRTADGTGDFVAWLHSHEDIDKVRLPSRLLRTLYEEFCEFYELAPLSRGRFERTLKQAGFTRRRLSQPPRPWVYQLPLVEGAPAPRPSRKPVSPSLPTRRLR